jgi:hypothetical protein
MALPDSKVNRTQAAATGMQPPAANAASSSISDLREGITLQRLGATDLAKGRHGRELEVRGNSPQQGEVYRSTVSTRRTPACTSMQQKTKELAKKLSTDAPSGGGWGKSR